LEQDIKKGQPRSQPCDQNKNFCLKAYNGNRL